MAFAPTSTVAAMFRPASMEAVRASHVFIVERDQWSLEMAMVRNELLAFVRAHTGCTPTGILSHDPFGMTAYGLSFDQRSVIGFKASDDACPCACQIPGNPMVPDFEHPVGQGVHEILEKYGQVAERRPLLNSIEGVASYGIADGHLVLTEAKQVGDVLVVSAAADAVKTKDQLVRMNAMHVDTKAAAQDQTRMARSRLN